MFTLTGIFFPQVKVMTELELLPVACEQFLGKSVLEIKAVVLQTLEGHLRSILGLKLSVILSLRSHETRFLDAVLRYLQAR